MIVRGLLVLASVLILAAVIFPFLVAPPPPLAGNCMRNLKILATATLMYSTDYHGRFPLAQSWQEATSDYHKDPDLLVCPAAPRVKPGYAFNADLHRCDSSTIRAPEKVPMLFESSLGRPNASDHLQSFASRHRGRGNVAFADGHAIAVTSPPAATVEQRPAGKRGRSGRPNGQHTPARGRNTGKTENGLKDGSMR